MADEKDRHTEKAEQIYQLTTLVAGRFSLQEVLDGLAEAAVRITNTKACSIRLLDEEDADLKMRSTYGLSEEYRNKGVVSKNDTVIKAAFAGQAVVIDDMRVDDRVKYKQASIKEGIVSQLTVAMIFRNRAIGVLRLYSPRPKRFDDEDISLARAVANQSAVAITNARLYAEALEGARIAEQMRLAGVIQRRMIPQSAPAIAALDIAAKYIPCFDVGGDFYDFLKISPSCIAIAIADVIGKGIPAALMTSQFRGALRAYADAAGIGDNIKSIVNKLNAATCRMCENGEFISLFYAVIDTGNQTITYCSCGHEPTLLIRDGKISQLQAGGLVLGVDINAEYQIETVKLEQDDFLLFYTDGLVDAADFDGRFWGMDGLLEAVKKFTLGSAEQMVKNTLAYRRRFVGLARQIDDTSLIAVKIGKT
ncbi:MAG: PP2C family protein-serine/threonine phosphatase [Planctomycetota bacterium]|jgi:serine phosphatase RsbU (regulator of sigma subunit)